MPIKYLEQQNSRNTIMKWRFIAIWTKVESGANVVCSIKTLVPCGFDVFLFSRETSRVILIMCRKSNEIQLIF